MPAKLLLLQNWGGGEVKWPICPNRQQGPLLEISYIPQLSVMSTLHYHRLYQISSLEANLTLEDMKQVLDRSHLHTGKITTPKLIIKPNLL